MNMKNIRKFVKFIISFSSIYPCQNLPYKYYLLLLFLLLSINVIFNFLIVKENESNRLIYNFIS